MTLAEKEQLRKDVVRIAWLSKSTSMDPAQIAAKVGCHIKRVYFWQRKIRAAQYRREEQGTGFGCDHYDPSIPECEACLNPGAPLACPLVEREDD